jgi:hypothetical protein
MRINQDKTRVMLFNTARKRDFTPSVSPGNSGLNFQVVEELKLLGIIITTDMKWHSNTAYLCQKGYSRLWMLRNLKRVGASVSELIDVYHKQCRSVLELAVPVWTAGLKQDDVDLLERVQKTACAIILGKEYSGYSNALKTLKLVTLEERRMELCLKFAHKSVKSEKYQHWFVKEDKAPKVNTRSDKPQNMFKPVHTRTDRYSDSPIPFLTRLLNGNM